MTSPQYDRKRDDLTILTAQINRLTLGIDDAWTNAVWDPEWDSTTLGCGRHVRATTRHNRGGRKYLREIPAGSKPGSCICDYTRFPSLLKERLEVSCDTPFRFMDLPTELRLECYEFMVTIPEAIEFCPEPWAFDGTAPVGQAGRNQFLESWKPIEDRHMATIKKFAVFAKLLRTSKQICKEAKPFLYRNNCFSFTNSSGWVALDLFMFQIGMENCRNLRHVVVRHPSFLKLPSTLKGSDHFASSMLTLRTPTTATPGIFYPQRWFELPLSYDPARVLGKVQLLKTLTFVLPPFNHALSVEDVEYYSEPLFDEENHKRLKVTLLSLRGEEDEYSDDSTAKTLVRAHNQKLCPGTKEWRAEEAVYDGLGSYSF